MPQGPTINCPSIQPAPGSTIVVTGWSPDLANTSQAVSCNGQPVSATFTTDPTTGNVKWEITVPLCEMGKPNVIDITLKVGNSVATCAIQIKCP